MSVCELTSCVTGAHCGKFVVHKAIAVVGATWSSWCDVGWLSAPCPAFLASPHTFLLELKRSVQLPVRELQTSGMLHEAGITLSHSHSARREGGMDEWRKGGERKR